MDKFEYYAVDVYNSFKRMRLPDCVLAAVRAKYPNDVGEPYTGHIDTE
jgi:hypothetical protein